jgi:tetratricopeptide (TPR) repeat protein
MPIAVTDPASDDIQLFVSYAHEDVDAARELFAHLGVLDRDAIASTWIDRHIGAGESWRPLIFEHLDSADIILLVLTPQFFESEFIRDYELKRAIERHRREEARVIPIAVEESGWRTTDIRHLQVIPDYGTPVATSPDREQAWREVVARVGEAAQRLRSEGLRRRPRRPGGQLWRVPFGRNPAFVGRDEDLAWLHQALTPDEQFEATAKATVAVTGLGGIGKTQLVLDYLYRRRNHYRIVWWIRAETPETIVADIADLAEPLGLEKREPPDRYADALAIREYLEHDSRWLLVFDNAPEPGAIAPFVPRAAAGHVVITSRHQDWSRTARVRELGTLEEADAAGLLNRSSGDADQAAATMLAGELGGLPLALAQAAGYMSATGRSIASYLDLYRSRRASILGRARGTQEYPDTLQTTWEISFEQVALASPAGSALLQVSAFLAADAIPVNLLFAEGGLLPSGLPPELGDPLEFDEGTAALRRVSLISMRHGDVSLHRLVQAATRDRMTEAAQQQYAGAALSLVNRAFPAHSASFETWDDCSRLASHAIAVVDHALAVGADLDEMLGLLFRTGAYLRRRGDFETARRCFERGLLMIGVLPGGAHPMQRHLTGELGSTLQEMGRLPEAREKLELALRIAQEDPDGPRLDVAQRHNDLGSVLEQMSEFDVAGEHYDAALQVLREECGPTDPRLGVALNNHGSRLIHMGRPHDAVPYLMEAVTQTMQTGGSQGPDHGRHLGNLGYAFALMGRFPDAHQHLSEALEILTRTLGPEYPETMQTRASLSRVEAHLARARSNAVSLDELRAAESIVQALERIGVLAIVFDSTKLVLDGPATHAPPELLDAATEYTPAIVQLLRATFARWWVENHSEEPAGVGIRTLGQVSVCLSVALGEDELIDRVRRSAAIKALKRRPAAMPCPTDSLEERQATLAAWAPYLPSLEED